MPDRLLSRQVFEALIDEAVASIPEALRARLDNIILVAEDWPSAERRARTGLALDPRASLYGLYTGVPRTQRSVYYDALHPDHIIIFQGPLERDFGADEQMLIGEGPIPDRLAAGASKVGSTRQDSLWTPRPAAGNQHGQNAQRRSDQDSTRSPIPGVISDWPRSLKHARQPGSVLPRWPLRARRPSSRCPAGSDLGFASPERIEERPDRSAA